MKYWPFDATITRVVMLVGALVAIAVVALPVSNLAFAQENGTIEYAENGTGPVATYTAMDPEGAMVMWSLDGDDAGDFMIENGVLSFKKSPNFEMSTGGGSAATNTSSTYTLTVKATDETRMTGPKTVMVMVTNVDEPGKVTLSARRPQSNTDFTAVVTDPDDGVGDEKRQWAKAGSMNGSYTNIPNAMSATYTPVDGDVGSYLRATVTYEDNEDAGKSAMMKSDFPVQSVRGQNDAPEFAAVQDPDGIGDEAKAIAKRSVAENTDAGKTVGSPVTATDDDGDTLTYTLTDADGSTDGDSAAFTIDWATGQIMTKGDLDHENKETYTVVVRATDPAGIPGVESAVAGNSGTVTVNITVTDKNEAPAVTGNAEATFDEGAAAIATVLNTYTAADEDEDGNPHPGTVSSWSVGGADGSKFNIGNETEGNPGDLKFKEKPDYEMPTDADKDNVYEVTVQASDGRLTGMKKVMVSVTNAEEAGVVTLSEAQPVVGIPVTASLTDPDGGISKLTWQWNDGSNDIEDATSDTYKPVAGDVNKRLKATASYFDGQSAPGDADAAKKTAMKDAGNDVELDSRNYPPVFGDEDPDTDGVQNAMATRKVEENTEANATDDATDDSVTGDNVGAAVAATDTKAGGTDETLTYSLGGADMGMFRVRDNGQIEVGAGTMLDYETKNTYMVTVMARDPLGESASIPVTIMVTDVDEAPEIMVGGLAISGMSSADYVENGTMPVETYTVTGPESASASWSPLSGDDASAFSLSNDGMLTFRSSPDYENPMDADMDNVYMVTIMADDGTYMDTHDVMVMVTNEDEMGRVTFWRDGQDATTAAIMVGDELGGAVDDSDGNPGDTFPITMYTRIAGVNVTSWQWAKSMTPDMMDSWMDIGTGGMYTVMNDDAGHYLRATAMYNDGEDTGKMKDATTMMVGAEGVDPLLAEYDPDGDGEIETADMRRAVAKFFSDPPELTRPDMRRLVAIFFQ